MFYASRDDLQIMRFDPMATMMRVIGRRDGRRLAGRLPQEGLECNLGPVLDLSSGGLRVLSKRPRDGVLTVHLDGLDVTLKLQAKVVWTIRHGFRRHEMGLELLHVDEEMGQILSRISRQHRSQRAIDEPIGEEKEHELIEK